jgi:hypothetical protein
MPNDDAELLRLRSLVGPSEIAYRRLADDLTAASEQARDAELAAGRLRGELAEMSVQLARARQDQDSVQRRREMGAGEYLADVCREYWYEVLRPLTGRVARRIGLRS